MAAAQSMGGRWVIAGGVLRLGRLLGKERGGRGGRSGNGHGRALHKIAAGNAAVHAQFFVSPMHRFPQKNLVQQMSSGNFAGIDSAFHKALPFGQVFAGKEHLAMRLLEQGRMRNHCPGR